MRKLILIVTLLMLLVSVVPAMAQESGNTIVDAANADARLNTFYSAVVAAGLNDMLSGTGPFTVFAPTDAAFQNVPTATLEALNSDPAALANLLSFHVLAGNVSQNSLRGMGTAFTAQGQSLSLSVTGGSLLINGSARIVGTINTSNGVIYLIDTVLMAPAAPVPVAVTGLNQRVLVVGAAPILLDPKTHGNQVISNGQGILLCQSVYITEIYGGYAKLRDQGGWIPTSSFIDGSAGQSC